MTYAEKLKSPKWQKKRLEILERDNWTCQECSNKEKTLHIHHLDYESGIEPWEYPDYYLVTLCEDCHQKVEERKKQREQRVLKILRLNLPSDFSWEQLSDIITSSSQLKELIFFIYDLGADKTTELLRTVYNKQPKDIDKRLDFLHNPCPACGSKTEHIMQFDLYKCSVCGYRPEDAEEQQDLIKLLINGNV